MFFFSTRGCAKLTLTRVKQPLAKVPEKQCVYYFSSRFSGRPVVNVGKVKGGLSGWQPRGSTAMTVTSQIPGPDCAEARASLPLILRRESGLNMRLKLDGFFFSHPGDTHIRSKLSEIQEDSGIIRGRLDRIEEAAFFVVKIRPNSLWNFETCN